MPTDPFHLVRLSPAYDPNPIGVRLDKAAAMAAQAAGTAHAPAAILLMKAVQRARERIAEHTHAVLRLRRTLDDATAGAVSVFSGRTVNPVETEVRVRDALEVLDDAAAALATLLGQDLYHGYDAEVLDEFTDAAGRTLRVFRATTRFGRPLDEPENGAVFLWWVEGGVLLKPIIMDDVHGQQMVWPEEIEYDGPLENDADAVQALKALVGV